MAINLTIYSNANNSSRTISVDFVNSIATLPGDGNPDTEPRYFLKLTTTARDTSNIAYPVIVIENMGDLALNGEKQSATNTAAPYANIKAALIDYVYDYVHGHTAGQFATSVTAKAAMKFST